MMKIIIIIIIIIIVIIITVRLTDFQKPQEIAIRFNLLPVCLSVPIKPKLD